MVQSNQLTINQRDVIYETFDDEVVLINLDNGNYYSIADTAAQVWSFIEAGYSVDDIVNEMAQLYQGGEEDIEGAVNAFISELIQDELIRPNQGMEAEGHERKEVKPVHKGDAREKPFVPPKLNRYTDMQDLLLLDPIHEVDEAGWPNPKTDPASLSDG